MNITITGQPGQRIAVAGDQAGTDLLDAGLEAPVACGDTSGADEGDVHTFSLTTRRVGLRTGPDHELSTVFDGMGSRRRDAHATRVHPVATPKR